MVLEVTEAIEAVEEQTFVEDGIVLKGHTADVYQPEIGTEMRLGNVSTIARNIPFLLTSAALP